MLADAGADLFQGHGMGPLAKWVDNHIFFQVPRTHLSATTCSTLNGIAKFTQMEGAGKKVAIYGTGAKAYPVGRWKNLMRTAVQSSMTLCSPLHDHLPPLRLCRCRHQQALITPWYQMAKFRVHSIWQRSPLPGFLLEPTYTGGAPTRRKEDQIFGSHCRVEGQVHTQPHQGAKALWEAIPHCSGYPSGMHSSHQHGGHARLLQQ